MLSDATSSDGLPLGTLKVRYRFDAFMQEPTRMFTMAWLPSDPGVKLGSVKFRARVVTSAWSKPAYQEFDPMIPKPGGKFSWDVAGSPDWDELFLDGKGGHLSEEDAKAAYRAGFSLKDLEIVHAYANKEAVKHNLPFARYISKTAISSDMTEIENSITKENIESALRESLGNADYERLQKGNYELTGKYFGYTHWIKDRDLFGGGKIGECEKMFFHIRNEKYVALRVHLSQLPEASWGDKEVLNHAEVTVVTSFNNSYKDTYNFELRAGQKWVVLLKRPKTLTKHYWGGSFHCEIKVTRGVNDKEADKKQGNEENAIKQEEKDFFDQKEKDIFAHADQISKDQELKEREAREADERAQGVTSLIYIVAKAERELEDTRPTLPLFPFNLSSGPFLTLVDEEHEERMREDPEYRRRFERKKREREEREARKRAENARKREENARKAREAFAREREQIQHRFEAQAPHIMYTDAIVVPLRLRQRSPLELSDEERSLLEDRLKEHRHKVLPRIPIDTDSFSDTVSITYEVFVNGSDVANYLEGKPTKPFPYELSLLP